MSPFFADRLYQLGQELLTYWCTSTLPLVGALESRTIINACSLAQSSKGDIVIIVVRLLAVLSGLVCWLY
jgi:hypothetical protein